jgi:hypothetical protein
MHLAPLLVTFLVLSGPLVVAGQTPSSKETHGAQAHGATGNAGNSTVPAIAKDLAVTVVTVTAPDDSGRPVTDLTSADFQVFGNDKLQTISSVRSNPAQLVRTNTVINRVEVTREGTIPRADRGTTRLSNWPGKPAGRCT